MHLEETPDQLALRAELRAYFAQLLTPEVRHALDSETEGGETFRRIVRQMGTDGWLGIGWPVEYGGQGRPPTDQFIFFTEVQRARAPFPFVTLSTVGPMIINHGTEQQKKFFLSGHPGRRDQLRHRLHRARGRHRPGLAAHPGRARRRRVGDQRQQDLHQRRRPGRLHLAGLPDRPRRARSTRASPSSWCRRPPRASRARPIVTVGGVATTASYYDDVRVPKDALVGRAPRRVAAHHRPAQPRAGRPGRGQRPGLPPVGRDGGVGGRARAWPTSAGSRPTWPAPTPCSRPRSC